MFVQHQIKDHAVAGAVGAQGGKVVQRIFHIVLHDAVGALHPHAAHAEPSSTGIGVENFVSSLPDAVQNAIAEVTGSAGLPPDRLTMEEKIRIVESLHHAGIFYMKGAVSEVAAQLGSSEATIYRYLSKLK